MAAATDMAFDKNDTDVFSPPDAGGATMSDDSDDDMAGYSDPPVREWSAVRGRRLVARPGQSEDERKRLSAKADI
eukprot:11722975-Karenia_brevis.AAC.1